MVRLLGRVVDGAVVDGFGGGEEELTAFVRAGEGDHPCARELSREAVLARAWRSSDGSMNCNYTSASYST